MSAATITSIIRETPTQFAGNSCMFRRPSKSSLTRMARILVVDDDPSTLEVISRYLAKCGHTVESAPNGRNAIEHILYKLPELIILDLCMPHFDGCSLLEVVRSYVRLKELPVIVLTGLSDGPLIQRARNLKVNTILTKGAATMEKIEEAVQLELRSAQN